MSTGSVASHPEGVAAHPKGHAMGLALAAIGVVFGDIGTSPLYTLKRVVGPHGIAPTGKVLGMLSLIFWSLCSSSP